MHDSIPLSLPIVRQLLYYTWIITGFACVLEHTHVSFTCIHFLICSVSILLGANSRMWIPFGITLAEYGSMPACLVFFTELLLLGLFPWTSPSPSPLECLPVSEQERDLLLFLFHFV